MQTALTLGPFGAAASPACTLLLPWLLVPSTSCTSTTTGGASSTSHAPYLLMTACPGCSRRSVHTQTGVCYSLVNTHVHRPATNGPPPRHQPPTHRYQLMTACWGVAGVYTQTVTECSLVNTQRRTRRGDLSNQVPCQRHCHSQTNHVSNTIASKAAAQLIHPPGGATRGCLQTADILLLDAQHITQKTHLCAGCCHLCSFADVESMQTVGMSWH